MRAGGVTTNTYDALGAGASKREVSNAARRAAPHFLALFIAAETEHLNL